MARIVLRGAGGSRLQAVDDLSDLRVRDWLSGSLLVISPG
jgi:hypothetical protein